MGDATDKAIAQAWPFEWARANRAKPGASKRRNNLRKRWRYAEELKAFLAANPSASCATCRHWEPVPRSTDNSKHCSIESDFYGYQIVKPDYVCTRWAAE